MRDIPHGKWLLETTSIVEQLNKPIKVARYQCDKGYLAADEKERRCSRYGITDTNSQGKEDVLSNEWSGETPKCLRHSMN